VRLVALHGFTAGAASNGYVVTQRLTANFRYAFNRAV
jgi:hypothetical protein